MYEVELTAKVENIKHTRSKILDLAPDSQLTLDYDDRYFDKNNMLTHEDQEFRLRTKTNLNTGEFKHYLTFKDKAFDQISRSKPEYETIVLDHKNTEEILLHLGYSKTAQYTKHCEVFNLTFQNSDVEIAIVKFDELQDTFIEIETITDSYKNTDTLLKKLYQLLEIIGLTKNNLTEDFYIEMIKEAKRLKS